MVHNHYIIFPNSPNDESGERDLVKTVPESRFSTKQPWETSIYLVFHKLIKLYWHLYWLFGLKVLIFTSVLIESFLFCPVLHFCITERIFLQIRFSFEFNLSINLINNKKNIFIFDKIFFVFFNSISNQAVTNVTFFWVF